MITCALLSRCSGSLSLITTSWALAGFWARKGVCPWWTVVVPLKNFCPRATVASAHASLNRSCSVVELFQALVLCFYQLQAAAVRTAVYRDTVPVLDREKWFRSTCSVQYCVRRTA